MIFPFSISINSNNKRPVEGIKTQPEFGGLGDQLSIHIKYDPLRGFSNEKCKVKIFNFSFSIFNFPFLICTQPGFVASDIKPVLTQEAKHASYLRCLVRPLRGVEPLIKRQLLVVFGLTWRK